jgi:hypothetical protein
MLEGLIGHLDGAIGAAVGVAIVALWARVSPKVAKFLTGVPEKYDLPYVDLPEWFIKIYLGAVPLFMGSMNGIMGDKKTFEMVTNRIRKNQGEEALSVFLAHAKDCIDLDKIGEALPTEVKRWYDLARTELAAEGIKAEVMPSVALLPVAQQATALKLLEDKPLAVAVKSAVEAAKISDRRTDYNIQPAEKQAVKEHVDFLSAESRKAVEEMRARLKK